MPTRPIDTSRKESVKSKAPQTTSQHHIQHGQHQNISLLFDVPAESLTHITSYLTPPSLLALARTCSHLYKHVKDDNTWLRAFLNQFAGISPEHSLDNEKVLLLRRLENTWRKEFILRHSLGRRWERSRNPTITHSPQDSSIDGAHLMSENGLLTSSLQYGVVARSLPLSGKVLKGYLDASGTGLGIGNPNVEFTPNVSVCTVSSDGGTARIFWGKRNGEVAVTVATRVMDHGRAGSRFIRCGVNDQHEGTVQQLVPDAASGTFLSAGADGRAKLWDSKNLKCLWSSEKQLQSLVTDPLLSLAGGLSEGYIAGALASGDILLWIVPEMITLDDLPTHIVLDELRVTAPIHIERQPTHQTDSTVPEPRLSQMWLYRTAISQVTLFIRYSNHPLFYRVSIDTKSDKVETTSFGDSSSGYISVIEPVISIQPSKGSMIIAGDQLGFVSVYDANAPFTSQTPVPPMHKFEAHTDGCITAISWNAIVLATGSARGTTVVWDALTLEPVRYFTSPAARPAPGRDWDSVGKILLDKELIVIIVGNRVMTWKVGQVSGREYQHLKSRNAHAKKNLISKGHQQYEMHKDISESRKELEYEKAHFQRTYGREREQRTTLTSLGLSESEAVEYVLMLSREEEERRRIAMAVDEGVFEGDFDELPGTSFQSQPSPPSGYLSSRRSSSSSTYHSNGRQYPRVTLPISNEKVQVSPPFVPEPMEAGTSISPLGSMATGSGGQSGAMAVRSTSSSSPVHFPAISSSLSSTPSSRGGMSTHHSVSSSPDQPRSAWSTPMRSVPPSPGPSSPRSRVSTPVVARPSSSNMSMLTADIARNKEGLKKEESLPDLEEMDDDLKFAIELSLAEARSRGEEV